MESERRTISPLLYYVILSGLTSLIFIVIGAGILALFSPQMATEGFAVVVGALTLFEAGLVTLVSWFVQKRTHDHESALKFIGWFLGRFFGILIGLLLGARIAHILGLPEILGSLAGAFVFYYVGRWMGTRLSRLIGEQLDKVFLIKGSQEPVKFPGGEPLTRFTNRLVILFFALVLPLTVVLFGFLFTYFAISIDQFTRWLPIARIVVLAICAYSIAFPWLMRKRWLRKYQSSAAPPATMVGLLGLSLSVLPALYGLILFLAMGASFIELCILAAAASIAAAIWAAKNPLPISQQTA